jgi:hypothetical protein
MVVVMMVLLCLLGMMVMRMALDSSCTPATSATPSTMLALGCKLPR